MEERLYEILDKPNQYLFDGEKLILEKDGKRITLKADKDKLSVFEEDINTLQY